MREYKRNIERTIRDIDRERVKSANKERSLMIEIRNAAKKEQLEEANIMAKDVVRQKQSQTRAVKMKSNLNAMSSKLSAMESTEQMMKSMSQITKSLKGMNDRFKIPEMQKIVMDFEKNNDQLDMKSELMEDGIDSVFGQDDEAVIDEKALVSQILDEVGFNMKDRLKTDQRPPSPPSKKPVEVDELQTRFDKLKTK